MTETLQRVITRIEALPVERQDAIAAAIEQALIDDEWDALPATPASQRFLDELVAGAREGDAEATRRSSERRQRDVSVVERTAGIMAPYRREPPLTPQQEREAFEQGVAEEVLESMNR